ncbi:hypothetical protein HK104_006711, partial [Borealophlyctis nickersoniae]
MHIPKPLLFTATVLIALSASLFVTALPAALERRAAPTSQVSGTCSDGSTLSGTFVPTKFLKDGPTGLLASGTLTKATCGSKSLPDTPIQLPVESLNGHSSATPAASGTTGTTALSKRAPKCDVLNLVLGRLDLNLLGLEVHLNKVILDIVAVPGAGQLL